MFLKRKGKAMPSGVKKGYDHELIERLIDDGWNNRVIGKKIGCDPSTVSLIRKNKKIKIH